MRHFTIGSRYLVDQPSDFLHFGNHDLSLMVIGIIQVVLIVLLIQISLFCASHQVFNKILDFFQYDYLAGRMHVNLF